MARKSPAAIARKTSNLKASLGRSLGCVAHGTLIFKGYPADLIKALEKHDPLFDAAHWTTGRLTRFLRHKGGRFGGLLVIVSRWYNRPWVIIKYWNQPALNIDSVSQCPRCGSGKDTPHAR